MISSVEVRGLDELLRKLRALPEAVQTKLVRRACASAVAVIKNEAIRLAPEWTGPVSKGHPPPGTLKNAIYRTRMSADCTPTLEVWKVSVRKGNLAAKSGKDAYYATWVEYGHYARVSDKVLGRRNRRAAASLYVLPHPFMRPAFESTKLAAIEVMREYVAANLPDVIRSI